MAVAYEYVVDIRAGFAKLTNDLKDVSKQFSGVEKTVGNVFKNINTIINSALAVGGVFAINRLKDSLIELAKRGEAAGSIAEGFQKLGGSAATIEAASRATMGLVGQFDLMKIANQAMLKGIPDVNKNFALMAEYAGRVANTLDMDTTTALTNLTAAIGTAKEKMLQNLGITIDTDKAFQNYAKAHGIVLGTAKKWTDVLSDQEQKLAKQEEVLRILPEAISKLAGVTYIS